MPRRSLGSRWTSIATRYRAFTLPRADGLPRYRVLLSFPAVLLILGAILIGTGINGTSSGAMFDLVSKGHDPQLIAGTPERIRSDEWYVGASWSIAQVQQGLPARNETMPGGMDAALPHDLPRLDWSVVFRPHLWGYLFLDVGRGMAWKWWVPGLALIAAAFCFLVTLLPRRPVLAAAIAVAFYFSPFFQWWFQPAIFWPTAWALATMTGLIWAVKNIPPLSQWIWAVVIGYLTVVMAMGIYAPFIVPVVLVVAFFAIGLVVEQKRAHASWLMLLNQMLPILVAGATGGVITLLWLKTKSTTVDAFLATSYPGARLTKTGSSDLLSLARVLGSSFSESLKRGGGFLGTNSSEASTFFLIGVFMLPVVGWIIYRSAKRHSALPWTLIGLTAVVLLFVAFFYVPGWDAVAHLLYLDRTSEGRIRIGLGLASIAILAYVIRSIDQEAVRPRTSVALATGGLFLLSQLGIAAAIYVGEGRARLFHDAPLWWAYALVSAAAIVFFSRRRLVLGTAAFLVVSLLSTITVNPVYRGVFDLRTTPEAQAVMHIEKTRPGAWVGIGGVEVSAILLESGAEAFNGVQGAPSATMWREIDPRSQYKPLWNRLAGIGWVPGSGEPSVSNPAPDQILVTFDACSSFAQDHVDYVLSDNDRLPTPCLTAEKRFTPNSSTLTIYRVIPKRG
ncbi:MAG TPA: hypothetical protein VGC18_02875 [Lacisediminihabitans sp.]|uniref:DUF7657 domain-containing protein n=1 Tax=Lacisediminihabitans sp. TaxID=2787631 RepID=UPI002ED796F5